jgi:hypothetical protein
MLARSTKIEHPLGALIDLPRLVPAFSSKGFAFLPRTKTKNKTNANTKSKSGVSIGKGAATGKDISETTLALETMGPFIRDSILLSAYDLHHGHLRNPQRFFQEKELIFIDSGGYELSPGFDQTEPVHWGTSKKKFSRDDYIRVLGTLPEDLPFVISNYDWGTRGRPLVKQIQDAQKLFSAFPNFMKNFIVKPVGNHRHVEVDEVVRHIKKFLAFDILGITEKELGKDLMERLRALAKIRLAMDRENVSIPIHVWGGLDPVMTPLYFFAGAEIFDGISWLRYAYIDGLAVYRDSYGVLVDGIETPVDHARALAFHHNLGVLRGLDTSFRDFVLHNGSRFDMFGRRAPDLERAYRALIAKVPELKGGQ